MEPLPKRPRSEFDGPGPQPHQDRGDIRQAAAAAAAASVTSAKGPSIPSGPALNLTGSSNGDLAAVNPFQFDNLNDIHRAAAAPDIKDVRPQGFSSAGRPKPCMKYFSTSGCQFGESCHFLHYVPGGLASLGLAPVVTLPAASPSLMQKKGPGAVGDPVVPINGYKTKICNRFNTAEGCKFGDRCHFAHGERDLRSANNMPRGNNRRPMANGSMGPSLGFRNGGPHFPNQSGFHAPSGSSPTFPPQNYAQPGIPGNNAGYAAPPGTGNVPSYSHQGYPGPAQQGAPTNNSGPVTYPAGGPLNGNVPVY